MKYFEKNQVQLLPYMKELEEFVLNVFSLME
jgi:hypothetical protein